MRWIVAVALLSATLGGCLQAGDTQFPVEEDADPLWDAFKEDREGLLEELAPPFVDCFQRRDSAIDPLSPIFHGCLDWHSAVHAAYAHHVLYERTQSPEYLELVEEKFYPLGVSLIDAEHVYQRAKGLDLPLTENPYGFGWFLVLARERVLTTGQSDLQEMADYAADMMVDWFQARLDEGDAAEFILNEAHPNYSWSLINLDVWARYTQDEVLKQEVKRFSEPLLGELDCPVEQDTNESREGFQPACLMQLAAVAHIWGDHATKWVQERLPEGLYVPPVEDPVNCHAGGLNFSRAFALQQLYWATNDTELRNNSVELIRYHVDRPDLYTGADYLGEPGYLCYGHWVAQFGVRAISLSYEQPPATPEGSLGVMAEVAIEAPLERLLRV